MKPSTQSFRRKALPGSTAGRPSGAAGRRTDVVPLPCSAASVRRLARRVTSFYEQRMRPTGLKLSQYSVLAHLSQQPQSLLQLARRLEMDRTTLTRSLRSLAANGWVTEVASGDARQRLLVVTAAGKRFRKEAHESWKAAQIALEKQLGVAFVGDLHRQLDHALSRLKPVLPEEN